jgi:hypothetical protein
MWTREAYALFSANAYEGPRNQALKQNIPAPWKRVPIAANFLDDPATGLRAHVYHNYGLKEIVIAFAGTHIFDRKDWEAIEDIAKGRQPKQLQSARNVYRAVLDYLEQMDIKARISFTGHSLGGALAQYMAIIVKGSSAETFGAPGILGALEDLANDYEPGYTYPVLNHVAYGDVIGLYGRHLGKVEHHIFDATDLMLPVLPLYLRSQLLLSFARGSYHAHTIDRYLAGFRRHHGQVCVPTGFQTYRNCKTYYQVKNFNDAGVAKKDYI